MWDKSYMSDISDFLATYRAGHAMLHRLWGRAQEFDNYKKQHWIDLDNAFNRIARDLANRLGHTGPLY
jgi:hypothetical protein